jgi:hypothetical protein
MGMPLDSFILTVLMTRLTRAQTLAKAKSDHGRIDARLKLFYNVWNMYLQGLIDTPQSRIHANLVGVRRFLNPEPTKVKVHLLTSTKIL